MYSQSVTQSVCPFILNMSHCILGLYDVNYSKLMQFFVMVSTHDHPNTTILKIVFVEKLDYILAASEDANIYVWGFDDDAVEALKSMKPVDLETLIAKYSILLDADSELLPQNNKFNLSAGWDRKICIWDLENGRMHDTFRNTAPGASYESLELACDGVIMDMDYSPKTHAFSVFQSGSGLNECEQVLSAQGGVCCLCIDQTNGSIVAGVQNFISSVLKFEDSNCRFVSSVNNSICKCLVALYVSCSWDKTVRVWNAWKMPKRKRHRKQQENKSGSIILGLDDNLHKPSTSGSEKKVEFAEAAEIKDIEINVDETTENEEEMESQSESRSGSRLTEEEIKEGE
ncbi:hypothetical protein KUTeg_017506 [Tegillarca granosa]|uniref:Uncharacterized protein n=1 Tax=Tegillarca granosa TaxID=220873 RepID=A0ABQ9EF31_TEGGR|nr:hypothetical protein KUTeg_017506 [Tegillarca granosa]